MKIWRLPRGFEMSLKIADPLGPMRFSSYFSRREGRKTGRLPLISFTFDDCPQSAFRTGGEILTRNGARGTFYVALGLMGSRGELGDMFNQTDLENAILAGHELGSHTYDHCDARTTSFEKYERSVLRNEEELQKFAPDARFKAFSYPFGRLTRKVKKLVDQRYLSSRSVYGGLNNERFDYNSLRSYQIYSCKMSLREIEETIDRCCMIGGWLIFYTHDVALFPSRYGCTPDDFDRIVQYSIKKGAMVAPISAAIEAITNGA